MSRIAFGFMESHVERITLGGAAAFMLATAWMYVVRTPNRVPFSGALVNARELDLGLEVQAQQLKTRTRGAEPIPFVIPTYATAVDTQHRSGVIGGEDAFGPSVRVRGFGFSAFGKAITVPGLEEELDAAEKVGLAPPIAPTKPVLTTGRSVARPGSMISASDDLSHAPARSMPREGLGDFSWVSIAAWFDRDLQHREMSRAGYASFRARICFTSVDVQRQERLATGEFSEWLDVQSSPTATNFAVPDPILDDDNGRLLNRTDVSAALLRIQQSQKDIIQPRFRAIAAGATWDFPPLDGIREADNSPATLDDIDDSDLQLAELIRTLRTGQQSDIIRTGTIEDAPTAAQPPSRIPVGLHGPLKSQRMKAARETLRQARLILNRGELSAAHDLAAGVIRDPDIDGNLLTQAARLCLSARILLARHDKLTAAAAVPVTHPANPRQTAVWFHDESVQAGKTYRYRMRVNLWNHYVGFPRLLREPSSAANIVVVGDWSPASESISVTPSTYFFLNSAKPDKSGARVDVYKWRGGAWEKRGFDIRVGDTIGGVVCLKGNVSNPGSGAGEYDEVDFTTGATVLDLRFDEQVDIRSRASKTEFNYRTMPQVVLVYLDPADGQVKERVLETDKSDSVKKKLDEET